MYEPYANTILARSIANEKLSHRESVQLEIARNAVSVLRAAVTDIVRSVKERLDEPNFLPTYCFEYAPQC